MHEQPNSSDHARHDLLAVAALADRDATGEEAARARAQVDACTECATLHAELVSLATSTRQLPAMERPRDFQLRPEDAQRLRPNRFRRLFGSFGTARDGFSRPLAMGLTTLGIAGLMLGILPGTLSFGGAASAPAGPAAGSAPQQEIQQTLGAAASAAPAEAVHPLLRLERACARDRRRSKAAGPCTNPAPAGGNTSTSATSPTAGPWTIAGEPEGLASLSDDSTGVSQLIVISGTLLMRRGLGADIRRR